MNAINWLDIQLLPIELSQLNEDIRDAEPIHSFLERVVNLILRDYPWDQRSSIIASYHPSQTYQIGEWISLPIHDEKRVHPPVFQIALITQAESVHNPIQGKFQVLTLDVNGSQAQLACGIPNAPFPPADLVGFPPEELNWLAKWIARNYSASLQSAIKKYITSGELQGDFINGMYTPVKSDVPDTGDDLALGKDPSPRSLKQPLYQRIWHKIMSFIRHFFRRGI
jgi:hypothetical protein